MTLHAKRHHVMVGRNKLMSDARSCEQKFLISRGLLIRLSTWASRASKYTIAQYFNYLNHITGTVTSLIDCR